MEEDNRLFKWYSPQTAASMQTILPDIFGGIADINFQKERN